MVSTGSEESFSEGMQAFGERHFDSLPRDRTEVVCLECLGGPILIVLEGEGMLRMRHYSESMRDALERAASAAGVKIRRGIRTVAATDAIIALRAGYPVVTLASVDQTKLPLNYHWPSDTPDALRWETISTPSLSAKRSCAGAPPSRAPPRPATATPPGRAPRARRRRRSARPAAARGRAPASRPGCSRSSVAPPRERRPRSRPPV